MVKVSEFSDLPKRPSTYCGLEAPTNLSGVATRTLSPERPQKHRKPGRAIAGATGLYFCERFTGVW